MTYDPNICTPTMFEEELRALAASPSFVDPQLDARVLAIGELRRAIKAVREIPGWSGESADTAQGQLERMEKNASTIETTLEDLRTTLVASTVSVASRAAVALLALPSASADGFLADTGRNLSGITDGWGMLDTGEAVAREEERLAAEREIVAITKLKNIREALTAEAKQSFESLVIVDSGTTSTCPPPIIDVDGIDRSVPPIGSNGPGTSNPGGNGGGSTPTPPTPESPTSPDTDGTDPTSPDTDGTDPTSPDTDGTDPTSPDTDGTDPTSPDEDPDGTQDDPTVDSPGDGTLPDTPGGPGVWNPGGGGSGSGIGGVGAGVGGAATLLGGRAMAMGGLSSASGIGGAVGSAPTSGRGLLGATGTSATGGRPGGIGMMGRGAGSDSDKKDGRSTLGGPIAPELDIEDDERPRSRGAQAGSRKGHR